MLAPHHAENSELSNGGRAIAQQLSDFLEFIGSEAVLPDHLGCNGSYRGGRHDGEVLLSHFERSFRELLTGHALGDLAEFSPVLKGKP